MRPGRSRRVSSRLAAPREEGGYIAVMTAVLLMVLMGLSAFAVDVGNWYLVGQQAQRAADAAALAGVTRLPDDEPGAFSTARTYSTANEFTQGATTTVIPSRAGPTKLKVQVDRQVDNFFGSLLGVPRTKISRHAVAEYVGPVAMGSPCNTLGTDPDPGSNRAAACNAVDGNFWASVNGPATRKADGDPVDARTCTPAGGEGCSGTTNTEYDPRGYVYDIKVRQAGPLRVELFDPAFVDVGAACGFGPGEDPTIWTTGGAARTAVNDYHPAAGAGTDRYDPVTSASSAAWKWCTGDSLLGLVVPGQQIPSTTFTLRAPGPNPWDPYSGAVLCTRTYGGYAGALYPALHKGSASYRDDIARAFRQWTPLCSVPAAQVGTYSVQVTTSVGGPPMNANAANAFSLRAVGPNLEALSIAGRERLGMFANRNGGTTEFHLARLPSGTGGNILKVRLFDVGDTDRLGRITIRPPGGGTYSGCTGSGVTTVIDSNCSFAVPPIPSPFDARYQTVNVPVPPNYTCQDSDLTACWVTLEYNYSGGSQPTDATSWSASLEGDPIRLVE